MLSLFSWFKMLSTGVRDIHELQLHMHRHEIVSYYKIWSGQFHFNAKRQKTHLRACASSEDGDQYVHSRSLIRLHWTHFDSQENNVSSVSSHVTDFHTRNKLLTAKLLNQGYRYHKLRKAFSRLYRRHSDLVSKLNVGLKSLLQQGLSEEIYACNDFSTQFRKTILRYEDLVQHKCYTTDCMHGC